MPITVVAAPMISKVHREARTWRFLLALGRARSKPVTVIR